MADWTALSRYSNTALVEAARTTRTPWKRRALAAAALEAVEPTTVIPVRRTDGAAPEKQPVVEKLDRTLHKLDTVPRMLVAALVDEITVDAGAKAGRFDHESLRVSVRQLTSEEAVFAPLAHELGHALHTVAGIRLTSPEEIDNRQQPRRNWERGDIETWPQNPVSWRSWGQQAFQTSWTSYRYGCMGEVSPYQERNSEELFACAFEAWVSEPEELVTSQPTFKRFFDAWCGRTPCTKRSQQVSEESSVR